MTAVNRDWHLASALLIDTAHPDGGAQLGRRRFVVVEIGLVGQVEAVRELGAAAVRLSTSIEIQVSVFPAGNVSVFPVNVK